MGGDPHDATDPTNPDYYWNPAEVDQISLCHRNESDETTGPLFGVELGHNFNNYSGFADAILFNVIVCAALVPLGLLYWRVIHKYIIVGGGSVKGHLKGLFSGCLPDQWRANFHDERTTFNIHWFVLDKTFLRRSYGVVGMQYLCFQRYIIGLLVVINILTLGIVLPINVAVGTQSRDKQLAIKNLEDERRDWQSLLATSLMHNLSSDSDYLWIHLALGWSFIPLSMYFMHLYCDKILTGFFEKRERSTLTLHVSRLPLKLRSKRNLRQWIRKKYPFAKVEKIYIAFETSHLLELYNYRDILHRTIAKCEKDTKLYQRECCKGYKNTPGAALSAYRKELKVNEKAIKTELKVTLKKPLDNAFVTLKTHDQAKFIVDCEKIGSISERTVFCSSGIKITFAPCAGEIEWVHMLPRRVLRCRRLVIVSILIVLILFFTTPQSLLIFTSHVVDAETHKSGFLKNFQYLTSVLKIITRLFINCIFTWSMKFMGYWKQVDINRNILRVTTAYMLLVLLFLPTFEFLNIKDIFEFTTQIVKESFRITRKKQHHWDCIFKPQGIIVFIHFLITTAFLGAAVDYLRIGDVLNTLQNLLVSRSWPEVVARIEARRIHFWFGEAYSLELLYLTMTVGLSISTPMMVPLGLIFFLIKHCLSSYHLKFNRDMYILTNIGFDFHVAAISYVVGATVCLQWYNALFFNLKKADNMLGFAAAFMAVASTIFLLIGVSSKWRYPLPIIRPGYKVLAKDIAESRDEYIPYYLKEFKSQVHSRVPHISV